MKKVKIDKSTFESTSYIIEGFIDLSIQSGVIENDLSLIRVKNTLDNIYKVIK